MSSEALPAPSPPGPGSRGPRGLASALRPRQWLKNVLVVAVPLAAGQLLDPGIAVATAAAFLAYCLASSATYLLNDIIDIERDRAHPRKQHRAIPSGRVSVPTAVVAAVVLAIAAISLGFLTRTDLGWSIVAYLAVTVTYTTWLKREPVIELALLTSGFLLRATAGAAATGIPVSQWFVIVAGFGSLFMAVGKRYSEYVARDGASTTRASLEGYSADYLRWVSGVSAAVTIAAYCTWAFQVAAATPSTLPWAELSVIPFVMAMLRYAVRIDAGNAEAPEEAVLGDRVLVGLGIAWAAVFALGAFGV